MLKKVISLIAVTGLVSVSAYANHHVPKNRISMEKAQEIAMKAQEGTIESKKLEKEHGKWMYSFNIRANDKQVHQIHVDAKSGKVLGMNTHQATSQNLTGSAESNEATAETAGEHNSLD